MVFYNATKLALTCVVDGWRREVRVNLKKFKIICSLLPVSLNWFQVQRVGENRIRISQICPGLVESEIMYANNPEKSDYSKNVLLTVNKVKSQREVISNNVYFYRFSILHPTWSQVTLLMLLWLNLLHPKNVFWETLLLPKFTKLGEQFFNILESRKENFFLREFFLLLLKILVRPWFELIDFIQWLLIDSISQLSFTFHNFTYFACLLKPAET